MFESNSTPYVSLGEAAQWMSGGTPLTDNPDYWGGEIPWISSASLRNFNISDSDRRVTDQGLLNGTRLAPAGAVLFVVRGMSLKSEFRVGVATRPVAFGQDCKALVPVEGIDSRYLAWFLKASEDIILRLVDEASHGTGRLETGTLSRVQMPLPPLAEQRRIVEILDGLDREISGECDVLSKGQTARAGLLETLLSQGRPVPLRELSAAPLAYGSGAAAIEYDPALPRYVRITDISEDGRLRNDTRASIPMASAQGYLLSEGDLLFARSGATVGKTYLYSTEDGVCSHAGYVIKLSIDPDIALPKYVSLWTQSSMYWRWVNQTLRQGAQPNINATEYASHELSLPSLREQSRVVQAVEECESSVREQAGVIKKLERLKQALMDDLLASHIKIPQEV